MAQTIEGTSTHTTIGHSTRRQDGLDKVVGNTRYAGDLPLPGLLHARLVLSPYAHARIISIDTSGALAIPGVAAVYTSETLGMLHPDSNDRMRSPLAEKEVLWCGHPVAIVLAESEEAARDGVDVVDVEYEDLPVVLDAIAAMQLGSPLARIYVKETTSEIAGGGAHAAVSEEQAEEPAEAETEPLSENVSDKAHLHGGDMAAGWCEAEVVVERTFRTSSVHQSYIEPQSITVAPGISKHHLTVW